jgi:hypothetical protein
MPPASRVRGQVFIEPDQPLFYWANAGRPSGSFLSPSRQRTAPSNPAQVYPARYVCRHSMVGCSVRVPLSALVQGSCAWKLPAHWRISPRLGEAGESAQVLGVDGGVEQCLENQFSVKRRSRGRFHNASLNGAVSIECQPKAQLIATFEIRISKVALDEAKGSMMQGKIGTWSAPAYSNAKLSRFAICAKLS